MDNIIIEFDIYDSRYRTNPDRATCFEAGCETLKEAKKSAREYGSDCVIVRTVCKHVIRNEWEVIESEIVN